ncbi:hypothetical protein GQ457_08G016080 [Hibiscus cannabinus]
MSLRRSLGFATGLGHGRNRTTTSNRDLPSPHAPKGSHDELPHVENVKVLTKAVRLEALTKNQGPIRDDRIKKQLDTSDQPSYASQSRKRPRHEFALQSYQSVTSTISTIPVGILVVRDFIILFLYAVFSIRNIIATVDGIKECVLNVVPRIITLEIVHVHTLFRLGKID